MKPLRRSAVIYHQLIEAERRMYASVNWTIIGSDNDLTPARRQAIIGPMPEDG